MVLGLCSDLFFASRIAEVARTLGVSCHVARDLDGLLAHAQTQSPSLIVIDLKPRDGDAVASIRTLRATPSTQGATIVGFMPHELDELGEAARGAGAAQVMARGQFSKQLPALLAAHAG